MSQAQNTQNTNAPAAAGGTDAGTGQGLSQFQMDYFFSADAPVSNRLVAEAADGGVAASRTATLDRLQRLMEVTGELVDVISGGAGDVGGQNEGQ